MSTASELSTGLYRGCSKDLSKNKTMLSYYQNDESRVLIELYNHPQINGTLIFRGGTALNKLYINPPASYLES